MGLSAPGLGSGLDVNGIVSKLMSVERQPLTQLAKQEATYQAKLTAYGSLQGALSTFQGQMAAMSALSVFQGISATPADATVLTASASTSATPGSYTVNVTNTALAQSLYAAGQTSTTAAIGAGATTTLTFTHGKIGGTAVAGIYPNGSTFTQDATQATGTVTIDATNNSLQGIRDAINNANLGVSATIVNDGSATPYRLVLTSTQTGANSGMNITVAGDATLQGLLGYDVTLAANQKLTQTVAPQDAAFKVNGVSVTSASNSVTTAISGVTMNLLKDASSTTLTVANNTASVQAAAQGFVSAYNSLNSTLKTLTAYDATTQQAGSLQGDYTAQTVQAQLRRTLSSSLMGVNGSLTSLSQIGISFQVDGSMALDSTKLQSAIANNFSDIAALFSTVGKSTDSLVSFVGSSANTQPGQYGVSISGLATQGYVSGGAQAVGTLVIDATNNLLNVTLDGTTATVTVPSKTYATAADLATALQSAVNGTTAFSSLGKGVKVTQNAGVFTMTSNAYGSTSNMSVTGIGASNLFGATPVTHVGTDVAGTIDGISATGSGQILTGATGTAAEGLQVQIAGGLTGSRGTMNFSRGYAYNLNTMATSMLSGTGLLTNRTTGINSTIKDLQNQQDAMTKRLTNVEANYRRQFTALDTLMSQMTQTSNYLTQQLASISSITNSSKK